MDFAIELLIFMKIVFNLYIYKCLAKKTNKYYSYEDLIRQWIRREITIDFTIKRIKRLF